MNIHGTAAAHLRSPCRLGVSATWRQDLADMKSVFLVSDPGKSQRFAPYSLDPKSCQQPKFSRNLLRQIISLL